MWKVLGSAGSYLSKFSLLSGKNLMIGGIMGLSTMASVKEARSEGRSPMVAGVKSLAMNIAPVLMLGGIHSMTRMALWGGLLFSIPKMPRAFQSVLRYGHQANANQARSVMPFSKTYSVTEQAYFAMQRGMQAMGQVGAIAGAEAGIVSARYMNNRY